MPETPSPAYLRTMLAPLGGFSIGHMIGTMLGAALGQWMATDPVTFVAWCDEASPTPIPVPSWLRIYAARERIMSMAASPTPGSAPPSRPAYSPRSPKSPP